MDRNFEDFNTLNEKIYNGARLVGVKQYYRQHRKGIHDKIENKLLPKNYQYPVGVQFELTYACNQKCIHCYNQSGGKHAEKEMSLDEWKKLAHRVGEMGVFQCIISGGEPTLLKEGLFEILDILDSYGIEIVLISNGFDLTADYVKRLRKYTYNWFQISIDGSRPDVHDFIRGTPSWKNAIKAANYVKQAGIPLVISHAITKTNHEFIDEMVEMAYLIGAKRIITGPFTYAGRAVVNIDEIELSKDEKKSIYEYLHKLRKQYHGRIEVAIAMEEPLGLRIKQCDINGGFLIRPNGDVKIDCMAPFIIGNVLEQDIYSIWNDIGRDVWEHRRVLDYIEAIHSAEDLLSVYPRINVDYDEWLV